MTLAKQTKAAPRSTSAPASLAEATELLKTLVGFDTTSAKSNLELIAFIENYLRHHRIGSLRVTSADGLKADLFATIGGSGDGGVALSGHSDCVPVEGQRWTSDPFALTERHGKLYGRGTCDMKGFIACVLASVPLFKTAKLKEPVHLVVSYDEEVGCTGVRPLIARLGRDLPRPRAVIVGEPTGMAVIDAHKRIDAYRTTVHGREAHSSLPGLGVNAISAAAALVCELDRIGEAVAKSENDPRFEPPCSTISVGTIKGGTAPNIVPKTCDFNWQVRSLPTASPDEVPARLARYAEAELLPKMKAVTEEAAIETKSLHSVPAFAAGSASEAVALALKLTGANDTRTVSYTTEAGLFELAGCPAVICGPGDIAQAHAADEYVSLDQMEACLAFLAGLAHELRG
ncbi:acetylornithine deacetylase [Methyloceanibacter sp.]|uniref:acetylornithine deacetylase n=1 Tax=Methyloceanibacter sp. TaxID=1965321 RepID=UPI002D402E37|nr:acetylornithine deacetylase [Methyloceanibacter sp.]HZP09869.1 acetylornithine deacetylase [Methyloceanibacter sp.]